MIESTENIARLLKSIWVDNGINGQRIVGGYPFESLELQRGKSVDDVLLDIRKSLAKLASQKICYLEDGISSSS